MSTHVKTQEFLEDLEDAAVQEDCAETSATEAARAIREFFSEIIRTIKILRTYPRDNSISISAVDRLTEMFQKHLEERGELEVFVDRHRLICGTETVHEDENIRRSIPLKLDRAGVRRLVFLPGIERKELLDLLDVLLAEIDEKSLQDDMATLMWEKQFTHIKIYVLDELTEDEQFDEGKLDKAVPGLSRRGTEAEPLPNQQLAREDVGPQLIERGKQLAAACLKTKSKLAPTTPEEMEYLRHELEQQDTCDVSKDLADILFEIISRNREDGTSSHVRKVLGQLVVMRMRAGDFTGSALLLEQIKELAKRPDMDAEQAKHLEELLNEVFTEDHVEEIRDILIANPDAALSRLEILAHYFPQLALHRLAGLLTLERDQTDVEEVLERIFAGRVYLLTEPLETGDDLLQARVMNLIEELAQEEDVEALSGVIGKLKGQTRERMVQVIARFRGEAAREMLQQLVSHEDASIRRTAIKALEAFSGGMNIMAARTQIASKDFDKRSLEEKKGLLKALAQGGDTQALETLKQIIENKGWFEKPEHLETRGCAVLALGETGRAEARPALETYTRDRSESIRAAAQLALSRLHETSSEH